MKKNDCIVVTGANGLAGSAVVERLRLRGYTCIVPITRDDVDLRNHILTRNLFNQIRPAYVYHAAALVYGLVGNMRNQGKSILDNTLINTSVIDACHQAEVKKIVAMGTNCIYPDPPQLPYHESAIFNGRPHPGEASYGHAKRHMLAMLEAYKESYGMAYSYIVSGNLYGPRDKFDPVNGHVMPALIWKFYQASLNPGSIVEIWGDGSARRDFLYSKDLAHIVEMVLADDDAFEIFNTGSGTQHNIVDVVKMLCAITGVSYDRIRFDGTKPNGRPNCTSDLTRLDMMGFIPSFSLHRGLLETWEWYCAQQKSATRSSLPAY
jgi:GDP-L-fucose synthase